MALKFLLAFALLAIHLDGILGHGMMMDPVSRSSAWRKGFKTPQNYNDNELFCGGFKAHSETNKGKCGICGDNFSLAQPRPNENGGVFGTGTIVQTYKAGQKFDITVRITANHWGTFKFHLCPLSKRGDIESEECFEKHPILLQDGSSEYKVPTHEAREFIVPAVLPQGVTCEHCSLRWEYRGGNNWGVCPDGTTGLGCGFQETFRNCADIKIVK